MPRRLAQIGPALCIACTSAASLARAEVVLLDPERIASQHLLVEDERTILVWGDGKFELVTDPADEAVSKSGDGMFHPMDVIEVERAVAALRGSIPHLEILVLPFPRRDIVESCCEGNVVFLAPGIRPVPREHVHATVAHEIGHVVNHTLCPEGSAAWAEYRQLRGLAGARWNDAALHRDRPREIFAEDFRALRGGDLANFSGSIENPDLPLPGAVAGLDAWFERLLEPTESRDGGTASPNPFRAARDGMVRVHLVAPTGAAPLSAECDIFDAAGRRVRTLRAFRSQDDGLALQWDGRNAHGTRVASGLYFVRWAGNRSGPARVHVLR